MGTQALHKTTCVDDADSDGVDYNVMIRYCRDDE